MGEGRVAAPDVVLAGRYRLVRPVARRPATTLWHGVDEVLARPVAVKVLEDPTALAGDTQTFLAAAVAAGRLTHPRIASTYDAAEEDGLVYVVSAWVDGPSLADVLRDGPLPPRRATTVAAQVAETVAYAHGRGVYHLDLDAYDVIVGPGGSVTVTDFELGAVTDPVGPAAVPGDAVPPEVRDTRAVAALLYACLTGRSAYGAEPDLPRAPVRDGKPLAPRQVRAGVPRELDAIVVRTLRPDLLRHSRPITSAEELLANLARLPGEAATAPPPPDEPAPPRPARRWLRVGVPLLVVAGLGITSLLVGLAVGRVPGDPQRFPGLGAASASAPAAPGQPIRPLAIRAFDPLGDRQENNGQVPLATDGDVSTAWSTTSYHRTPLFGGLKPGAGLLVDLGTPVPVSSVRFAFAAPGLSLELRAGDAATDDVARYRVVASATDVGEEARLRPTAGTTARYWLLWITRLVPAGNDRFSAGIAEFAFYR